MFEGMRSDLTKRLHALMDRYGDIEKKAISEFDESEFATRLGASEGGNLVLFEEIAVKSREQGDLCAQAIEALILNRAFPLIFRKSVKKAEAFADQCEQILASIDRAKEAGRKAARAQFGLDQ